MLPNELGSDTPGRSSSNAREVPCGTSGASCSGAGMAESGDTTPPSRSCMISCVQEPHITRLNPSRKSIQDGLTFFGTRISRCKTGQMIMRFACRDIDGTQASTAQAEGKGSSNPRRGREWATFVRSQTGTISLSNHLRQFIE